MSETSTPKMSTPLSDQGPTSGRAQAHPATGFSQRCDGVGYSAVSSDGLLPADAAGRTCSATAPGRPRCSPSATTVPNSMYILLAGGVLNTVLVPQIVRAIEVDADRGEAYTNRIMTAGLIVWALITLRADRWPCR